MTVLKRNSIQNSLHWLASTFPTRNNVDQISNSRLMCVLTLSFVKKKKKMYYMFWPLLKIIRGNASVSSNPMIPQGVLDQQGEMGSTFVSFI